MALCGQAVYRPGRTYRILMASALLPERPALPG